jgi:hypothetical protein
LLTGYERRKEFSFRFSDNDPSVTVVEIEGRCSIHVNTLPVDVSGATRVRDALTAAIAKARELTHDKNM